MTVYLLMCGIALHGKAALKGLVRSPFRAFEKLSAITITAPHIFKFTAENSHFANFYYAAPRHDDPDDGGHAPIF